MRKGKIKVLFIAGPTRSGSTIISNILGQIDGFFHAGEIIEAWDRGRLWPCSCGKQPDVCDCWTDIFKTLDLAISKKDQKEIAKTRNKLSKSHRLILNQLRKPGHETFENLEESKYFSGLGTLYRIIKEKTGAEVIVDSSKNVGYAENLRQVKTIDLYILHLQRDSRATVFSWSKKKGELWRSSPISSAVVWNSRNLASELIKTDLPNKYLRLRYEDYIKSPYWWTQRILRFLKIEDVTLPFISSNEVVLKTSHGLCGNPGRYCRGVVKLTIDERWKSMKLSHAVIATLLTWPFLIKYKYQLIDLQFEIKSMPKALLHKNSRDP